MLRSLSLRSSLSQPPSPLSLPNSSTNFSYSSVNLSFLETKSRRFSTMSASNDRVGPPQDSSFRGGESFFRNILSAIEAVYLSRNPTAKSILELVRSADDDHICYDHFAFRTFGVNGHGIDSIAKAFMDFGYIQRDELRFPAKKLKAFWFSPPNDSFSGCGGGVNGPMPRIFISELLVDQMSDEAQKIIEKYTKLSGNGFVHAALSSALGCLTWEKPSYSEFQLLARESEYAAWTLVNGYALNHVTISAHRLKSNLRNIKNLNQFIEDKGFKLNSEGGILKGIENRYVNPLCLPAGTESINIVRNIITISKYLVNVSPDGLLLQSSTVADSAYFQFSEGITESIPRSYIEFAERLVLPQFKDLPDNKVEEFHRRDGFEVGNADKIFESTSKVQG